MTYKQLVHWNPYNYSQHCKAIEAHGLIFKCISERTQANRM